MYADITKTRSVWFCHYCLLYISKVDIERANVGELGVVDRWVSTFDSMVNCGRVRKEERVVRYGRWVYSFHPSIRIRPSISVVLCWRRGRKAGLLCTTTRCKVLRWSNHERGGERETNRGTRGPDRAVQWECSGGRDARDGSVGVDDRTVGG